MHPEYAGAREAGQESSDSSSLHLREVSRTPTASPARARPEVGLG
ncbi:hypothetical protein GCM10022197_42890 [Microlunatus spumicola]|uniref:Uncharacterized protein n=1 Tax=Microlunatus spumicola TaxID=81499 RepID=A0ABP6YEM9_9ACTN